MIITDLNYMETTEVEATGASGYYYPPYYPVKYPFFSVANADAYANAFGGLINTAGTKTYASTGPGFASASSNSAAASSGYTYH